MKNKIKILHLTKGMELYGAQRVILNLVENSSSERFDASIATFVSNRHGHGTFIEEIEKRCGNAITIKCKKRIDIHALQELIAILKKQRIDILHCHEMKSRLYGLIAARALNIPVVTTHHNWTGANRLVKVYEYLDAFYIRFFDQIVAVSEELKHSMLKLKVPAKRISVIINGINLKELHIDRKDISYLKKKIGIKNGTKIIGNVGRLSVEKGHKLFLTAAKLIQKEFPAIQFLIAGDGPLKSELKFCADNLGLKESVFFTGFCSNIQQLYLLMDIFLLTSSVEGTPMAMMEAMAMGVPVVATNVGGVSKILHQNQSGILSKNNEPEEVAESVISLLKNPNELARLATNAKKTIEEKHSAAQMAKQYENMYMNIINKYF